MNSSFLFRSPVLAAAAVVAISTGAGYADSLSLIGQASGQYDYGIQIDANHGLVILLGDEITLTGLSNVIGASVLHDLSFAYFTVITSSDSVTIVDTTPFVLDPLPVSHSVAALRVLSSVSTTGPVTYQVQTGNEGVLSGTVPGPVTAAPEPAGLPAVAAALAALLILKRSTVR